MRFRSKVHPSSPTLLIPLPHTHPGSCFANPPRTHLLIARTQQRLQHDLEALEAERRVERRDRTALAVRLRAAEAAAGAAGDRLTALQGLLSQREADLARCNAALAESQAARSALEAEERRLAGAIASLGARVDSECEGLRAEVAALKRAAEQRESLVTELTVSHEGGMWP